MAQLGVDFHAVRSWLGLLLPAAHQILRTAKHYLARFAGRGIPFRLSAGAVTLTTTLRQQQRFGTSPRPHWRRITVIRSY
jgi:hypothetical protein